MPNQKWSALTPITGATLLAASYTALVQSGANNTITMTELITGLKTLGLISDGIIYGNGSPEGVVTCYSGRAIYFDDDPASPTYNNMWRFNGVAGTNTGWI